MNSHVIIRKALPRLGQGLGASASARRIHLAALATLTVAFAAMYSMLALSRYYKFKTSSYDLVIFDQAVRSYAHFQPGISIIKGLHNGFGPHFSVLGDHFSPILATLAPLYWIHNSPVNLLLAQAVLFALAIPPLWVFARRAFGGGRKGTAAAYLTAVAYALSWPLASANTFDFHEVAFAPVLTAVALERLQAGKLRAALLALAALLLVKEDMGLLVAGIGIYLVASRPRTVPRQWMVGAALIVGGVAYTFVAVHVLIPAFGGRANYYWAYSALGPNLQQAVLHLIFHPISSLQIVITPQVKLYTMLWLFGAFCFLPLRSPIALATLLPLAERMFGTAFHNWWSTSYHYNAFLVVILAAAAVDGAARLDRSVARLRSRLAARAAASAATQERAAEPGRPSGAVPVVAATAMCAVAVFLVPQFGFSPILNPAQLFHRNAHARAASSADAVVPDGVVVEAANHLGPQLSGRDTVLLWDGDGTSPLRPPWVVAQIRGRAFSWRSEAAEVRRVAYLERTGYKVVFKRDGYVVLHNVGGGSAAASRQAAG